MWQFLKLGERRDSRGIQFAAKMRDHAGPYKGFFGGNSEKVPVAHNLNQAGIDYFCLCERGLHGVPCSHVAAKHLAHLDTGSPQAYWKRNDLPLTCWDIRLDSAYGWGTMIPGLTYAKSGCGLSYPMCSGLLMAVVPRADASIQDAKRGEFATCSQKDSL